MKLKKLIKHIDPEQPIEVYHYATTPKYELECPTLYKGPVRELEKLAPMILDFKIMPFGVYTHRYEGYLYIMIIVEVPKEDNNDERK